MLFSARNILTRSYRFGHLSFPVATASPRYFSASAAIMGRVSDSIKDDHRALEEAYKRIMSSSDLDERTRWQNQFTWTLARHSIAEELVVYPAMEKYLPNGKAMADKDRQQHQTVKNDLYKFQGMKAEAAEFVPTLEKLMGDLRPHIQEEETEDLVALESAMGCDDSEYLAKEFELTKKFVNTESHPSVPDKPPGLTVAGLLTSPIDHIKDLFKKFPRDVESDMPP